MTVRSFAESARKHWLWVVLPPVLLGLVVGLLSMQQPKVYRSAASLYVSLSQGNSAVDLNQGSSYAQSQMQSFAALVTTPIVLDPVIRRLDLSTTSRELAKQVSATTSSTTTIMQVSATSGDPQRAAAIAGAVASELSSVIADIAPRNTAGKTTVSATIVDPAGAPQYAIGPSTKRNAMAAGLAGLVLGLVLAYLRDALDTRVRRPEDVEVVVKSVVLGQVGADRRGGRRRRASPTVRRAELVGPVAEDFGRLRVNLRMVGRIDQSQSFVVSSALPGEGKSYTATHIALSLAAAGTSVLLVDADLRRPAVAEYLGIEGGAGLTECLIGRAALADVEQSYGPHLAVLASGAIPPNPSELLSTRAFEDLLDEARRRYEVVIFDAPPLLPVADAVILSRLVNGAIIVADATRVRRAQLRQAVDAVRLGGGRVVGVVLNRVKQTTTETYAYSPTEPGAEQAPMRSSLAAPVGAHASGDLEVVDVEGRTDQAVTRRAARG